MSFRNERIRKALRLIASGKDVERKPVDIFSISARVAQEARDFSRKLRERQARYRQKFGVGNMRFRG